MKAWTIKRYGNDSPLVLMDLPKPKPGPGEVLVAIKAASVNPVDLKIREGKLKKIIPHEFPLTLGNDCSGVVVELGSAVRGFKIGDEVYLRAKKDSIGTFAEFIAADASTVALKPKNTTFEQAAALP